VKYIDRDMFTATREINQVIKKNVLELFEYVLYFRNISF